MQYSTVNSQLLQRAYASVNRFDVLIITALIWFLGKFIRYVFPPLFESLQGTYMVSTTVLGWTFSAFLFAYALVQFPSGVMSDSLGTVRVISGGVLLASTTTILLFFDVSFVVFVTIMFLIGAGTGIHKTSAVQLLSRIYPSHRGRALGVFDTLGTFGGVVAPVATVAAASIPSPVPGWRLLLLISGVIGLLFAISFILTVPQKLRRTPPSVPTKKNHTGSNQSGSTDQRDHSTAAPSESHPDSSITWRSYIQLFNNRNFVIFVTVSIFFSFTYYGIVAFLPLYLTQEGGVSDAVAGLLYSVVFIASIVQVGSGEISDKVGPLPVISGALALATLSIVIFILATDSNLWIITMSVLALGLGVHSFRPVRGVYLMETLPDRISAGGFGIVRTLLMMSGAISPGIVGTLSDISTFRAAFWMLAGSILIATILSLYLIQISSGGLTLSQTERDRKGHN